MSINIYDLNVFLWDLILSKLVRVRVVSVSYLRRVSLGYDADTVKARHVAKMCPWTGSPNIFILSIPTQPHKPLTNVNTSMCFFVPPEAQKTMLVSSVLFVHSGGTNTMLINPCVFVVPPGDTKTMLTHPYVFACSPGATTTM